MIMPYEYPVNWDALIFYLKELGVELLNKNSKNGNFSTKNGPKMALNGQNSQIFFMDPVRL